MQFHPDVSVDFGLSTGSFQRRIGCTAHEAVAVLRMRAKELGTGLGDPDRPQSGELRIEIQVS
jgi:hypothetical protein